MLRRTHWEWKTGHYRRHFGTVALSDSLAFGTFVPRKPPSAAFSELSSDFLQRVLLRGGWRHSASTRRAERKRPWRSRASAGAERAARPPLAARGGEGIRDGPTDRPANPLRACPFPALLGARAPPPPRPTSSAGLRRRRRSAPRAGRAALPAPPRPAPSPARPPCSPHAGGADREAAPSAALGSEALCGGCGSDGRQAAPGPAEAAAEGSVKRQRRPGECEGARSGRDEPGWEREPRLPCLGRAACLSRLSARPPGAGGWVPGTARGWVL
ncbi:hypothetical protein ACRRTK_020275 [Alexandromys fortis]